MATLPDWTAFGARPDIVLPRRVPQIASYRPTTGLEDFASHTLAHEGAEFENAGQNFARAQEYQDTIRAEDAFTQLRQKQIDLTYGDNGFALLKGGDAVNKPLLKVYGGALDQAAHQISGTLDNGYQQQLFQKRANVAGLELRQDIVKHVAQQTNVYDENVLKGTIDTEVQNAAARWADPDAPILPIQRIYSAIDTFADRNGMPDVWSKDEKAKALNRIYSGIVLQANVEDPEKAEKLMALHADDLNAGTRAQLDAHIKSQMYTLARRDEITKARDEAEHQRVIKQAQDEQLNKYLGDWNDHKLTPDAIVHDTTLSFPQKHVMLEMLQQQTQKQGEMKTDPHVFMDLLDRIHQPYSSKEKITDENQLLQYVKTSGGIDYNDLQKLRKEVRDVRDPVEGPLVEKKQALLNDVKDDLVKSDPLIGIKDPRGQDNFYNFRWAIDRKIDDWKKQGKDPMELFNPDSKDFLGKMRSQYVRTPLQIMQDRADEMRTVNAVQQSGKMPEPKTPVNQVQPKVVPGPVETPIPKPTSLEAKPARKEGESAADYLKRIR